MKAKNSVTQLSHSKKHGILIIDGVITLAIMILIFRFSSQDATHSAAMSDGIAYRIIHMLQKVVPGLSMDMTTFLIRKTAHFSEYTLLGFFMARTVRDILLRHFHYAIPWCLGTCYAVSHEIHQMFVPGRSCELRDMCIDSAGVFLGVLILLLATKKKKSRY